MTDDPFGPYIEELWRRADAENVPSGMLHWSLLQPYRIADFDGGEWRSVCDQKQFFQLQLELQNGAVGPRAGAPYDAVQSVPAAYHLQGITPISIAYYDYQTPRRAFVGAVMNAARRQESFPAVESLTAARVLETRRAFFASAVLQTRSDAFELLPYEHDGLSVHFVVPRELFLTNVEGEPSAMEIDFDDGAGFRGVAFGEVVPISYEDELPKQIRLRLSVGNERLGASFRFAVRAPLAPAYLEWELTAVDSYAGSTATGWAWVFLSPKHTEIEDPIIFADGFGAGSSSVNELWQALDAYSLATDLRDAGKDLILLGYKNKADYIQANALLAVACIRKTIAKRKGTKPLAVGGGSMGGVVTRYALLWMESRNEDHQTTKYLSYDAPHQGAWLPIILQYLAYRVAQVADEAKQMVALIQHPATRQLLWAWVAGLQYAPHYDSHPLKVALVKELATMGSFPQKPRRFGVANGANGVGNGINAGAFALHWSRCGAGAELKTQPPYSETEKQFIGGIAIGKAVLYYTTRVQAMEGAPGGLRDWFGAVAALLRAHGDTKLVCGPICFVWSASALAASRGNIYASFQQHETAFHEVAWGDNSFHAAVTPALAQWVLQRFK